MPNSLILKVGLYPETQIIESALSIDESVVGLGGTETLVITPESMNDADWDSVADRILQTSKIVTI